jgi:hypothetical protein
MAKSQSAGQNEKCHWQINQCVTDPSALGSFLIMGEHQNQNVLNLTVKGKDRKKCHSGHGFTSTYTAQTVQAHVPVSLPGDTVEM